MRRGARAKRRSLGVDRVRAERDDGVRGAGGVMLSLREALDAQCTLSAADGGLVLEKPRLHGAADLDPQRRRPGAAAAQRGGGSGDALRDFFRGFRVNDVAAEAHDKSGLRCDATQRRAPIHRVGALPRRGRCRAAAQLDRLCFREPAPLQRHGRTLGSERRGRRTLAQRR